MDQKTVWGKKVQLNNGLFAKLIGGTNNPAGGPQNVKMTVQKK